MAHMELWKRIKERKGMKVVNFRTFENKDVFEINEYFQDEFLFLKALKRTFEIGGIIYVRQVLSESHYRIAGISIHGSGRYVCAEAEDTAAVYVYDSELEEEILKQKEIDYVTLDELF